MIRKLIYNAYHALRLKPGWGNKVSYFINLTALGLKSKEHANKKIVHRLLGYKMNAYSYDTLDFLFREIFITHDYFVKTTTPTPLIIDCGANIGMSVLYFKKLFPQSTIIAFEANPHTFNMLDKNIQDNHLSDVTTYNLALYHEDGELSFFIGEDIGTLVGSIRSDRGGSTELKVAARKLSSYFHQFKTIDIVKMDVEGAERNIIDELYSSGEITKADQYIIEYHHNINNEPSRLSEFLSKFELSGFNYTVKTGYISPQGFQDILIHCYKSGL